jgi:hypothetical protein
MEPKKDFTIEVAESTERGRENPMGQQTWKRDL